MLFIGFGVVGLTLGALFVLNAFRSNLVYFYSSSEILQGKAPRDKLVRLGGMVKTGSVKKSSDGLKVNFAVIDGTDTAINVYYEGLLPDLFREGQGVVAQGTLTTDNRFVAKEVLAKHDEKYMPPEAAKAMQGGAYKVSK
jgi:cytochrome c-type biogenesis protein CcmE